MKEPSTKYKMEVRKGFLRAVPHSFKSRKEHKVRKKKEIIFYAPFANRKCVQADGKTEKGTEVTVRACNRQPFNLVPSKRVEGHVSNRLCNVGRESHEALPRCASIS